MEAPAPPGEAKAVSDGQDRRGQRWTHTRLRRVRRQVHHYGADSLHGAGTSGVMWWILSERYVARVATSLAMQLARSERNN